MLKKSIFLLPVILFCCLQDDRGFKFAYKPVAYEKINVFSLWLPREKLSF